MANAMFSVPRGTMKGGSLIIVTRRPFSIPNATETARPQALATCGSMPNSAASAVMTIPPNGMIIPQARSIPAVRMTNVCPMATTPTTITCCTMSEKFCPLRKRPVCRAKKTQARTSATDGPRSVSGGRRSSRRRHETLMRSLAPAIVQAELGVLAVDAGRRLVGDERHPGIGVPGGFLARLGVLDAGGHSHAGHLQRILLRGRGDDAGLDVLHAHATAIDGHDHHALLLAGGLQRLKGPGRRGLVDRVHQVDVGGLLQAVLHRRLP